MRDRFPEFYSPSDDDLKRFILEGVIVPDANILLDLYRLSTPERDEVFTAFEAAQERLWLTYQAGLEYQRNRMGVIRAQASAYEAVERLHGIKSTEEMTKALGGRPLPDDVKESVEPLLIDLDEKLREATVDYTAAVAEIAAQHVVTVEQGLSNDPVRARLDTLFEGRVGEAPTPEERVKRIKEAQRRYAEGIPPGFKDANKDTSDGAAGDYLVWAEILDYATELETEGKPVLFVTSDVKEDWFEKSGGEPIGPQPALVREFATRNTHGYHQVTLADFLRLANEHLDTEVLDATIERASELDSDAQRARSFEGGRMLTPEMLQALTGSWKTDPEMLRAATGLGRIDPETLRALTGGWNTDPEMLRAATGLGRIDPETLRALTGGWNTDPEVLRAVTGIGKINPDLLPRIKSSIADLEQELIERAAQEREDRKQSGSEGDDDDGGESTDGEAESP